MMNIVESINQDEYEFKVKGVKYRWVNLKEPADSLEDYVIAGVGETTKLEGVAVLEYMQDGGKPTLVVPEALQEGHESTITLTYGRKDGDTWFTVSGVDSGIHPSRVFLYNTVTKTKVFIPGLAQGGKWLLPGSACAKIRSGELILTGDKYLMALGLYRFTKPKYDD